MTTLAAVRVLVSLGTRPGRWWWLDWTKITKKTTLTHTVSHSLSHTHTTTPKFQGRPDRTGSSHLASYEMVTSHSPWCDTVGRGCGTVDLVGWTGR